jgi:hypothetical protein
VTDDAGVRRVLSDLPPVEPPSDFLPGLVRRTRRRARGLVASGVVGSLVVLSMGVAVESGVDEQNVVLRLDNLLDQHRVVTGSQTEQTAGFEPTDDEELGAPYWAPEELDDSFHRMGAFEGGDLVQVAYSNGRVELSVFEEPGDLDRSALRRQHLDRVGHDGWMMAEGGTVLVVVERGDMVYTVAGDADPEAITTMAEDLPGSRSLGVVDRLREVGDDLVELFALA